MVTTDDPERASWLRRARLHGMSADAWRRYLPGGGWRYDVLEAGMKANMTDLQAAIGRGQLARLARWQELRAHHRGALRPLARRPSRAGAPAPAGTGRAATPGTSTRCGSWTPSGRATRSMAALDAAGVGTSVHFIPIHHLEYFGRWPTCRRRGSPARRRSSASCSRCRCTRACATPRPTGWPMRSPTRWARLPGSPGCAPRGRARPRGPGRCPMSALQSTDLEPAGLRTLIVGAGEAGRALGRDLQRVSSFGLDPVGFLDDAPGEAAGGRGVPAVLGVARRPGPVLASRAVDVVVIAIPSLSRDRVRQLGLRAAAPASPSATCRRSWPPCSARSPARTCARCRSAR